MTQTIDRLLNARSKQLPSGYSYKLSSDTLGLDVAVAEPVINEAEMSVEFLYADGNRRDGVGDVLTVEGIDTSRHRLNPICLADHGKSVPWPIGTAEDPSTGHYWNMIDAISRTARIKCWFYQGPCQGLLLDKCQQNEHALFCSQLFDLVAKKFVRGGSIGYQVRKAIPLQADIATGTPAGLHLLSVLMLEASLVIVPANADCVLGKGVDLAREVLGMPKVCGKPLNPYLQKSFTKVANMNTRVSRGYEAPTKFPKYKARRLLMMNERQFTKALGKLTDAELEALVSQFSTQDMEKLLRLLGQDPTKIRRQATAQQRQVAKKPVAEPEQTVADLLQSVLRNMDRKQQQLATQLRTTEGIMQIGNQLQGYQPKAALEVQAKELRREIDRLVIERKSLLNQLEREHGHAPEE